MEKKGGEWLGRGAQILPAKELRWKRKRQEAEGKAAQADRRRLRYRSVTCHWVPWDAVGTPGSAACSPEMEVSGKKSKNTGSLSSVFYSF